MDLTQLMVNKVESSVEAMAMHPEEFENSKSIGDVLKTDSSTEVSVSLEAEIPEELYRGMKKFICSNPQWDQYTLMSSALANFLFQNGCENRAVTEKYLDDLFTLPHS